jgi:parvulin-like peptidyl-prolyl isomerase
MKYFGLLILFFSFQAFGGKNSIIAVVDETPITKTELLHRKKMVQFFHKIPKLGPKEDKQFTTMILNELIEEQLLFIEVQRLGIIVSDEEFDSAIAEIEQKNNFGKGKIGNHFKNNGIDLVSFNNKIKSEILKSKLVTEVIMKSVSISQSEIDEAIIGSNSKDVLLTLEVIKGNDDSKKTYQKMLSLSEQQLICGSIKDNDLRPFAGITNLETKLSTLSTDARPVLTDLKVGEHSNVVKIGDNFYIYLVCNRQIENLSQQENSYITQLIGNKKLMLKLQKHLSDLRKKAYVKIYDTK